MLKPLLELYVKTSSCEDDIGSCPICQTWFMIFYQLVDDNLIDLQVTPVNIDNPCDSYKQLGIGRKLPAVKIISGKELIDFQSEILRENFIFSGNELYDLLKSWKCKLLNENSKKIHEAELSFLDLYRDFKLFLTTNNFHKFNYNFKKLDDHFAISNSKFLVGDFLSISDCELMPKLQHIRITCIFLKEIDVFENLDRIKAYIDKMYSIEAFIQSCPSDRNIILHYRDTLNITVDQLKKLNSMGNRRLHDIEH